MSWLVTITLVATAVATGICTQIVFSRPVNDAVENRKNYLVISDTNVVVYCTDEIEDANKAAKWYGGHVLKIYGD